MLARTELARVAPARARSVPRTDGGEVAGEE